MSTPTPRTDSEEYPEGEGQSFHVVSADFARTLERELAAERARLDWLMAGGVCLVQHSEGFHVCRLNCQVSRADIDSAMKEDAQ